MYVLWPQTFGRTLLGRYIAVNIVLIKRKFPTDVHVGHKVVNIKYSKYCLRYTSFSELSIFPQKNYLFSFCNQIVLTQERKTLTYLTFALKRFIVFGIVEEI